MKSQVLKSRILIFLIAMMMLSMMGSDMALAASNNLDGMRAMAFPVGIKKAKEYYIENLNEAKYMGSNVYFGAMVKNDIELYNTYSSPSVDIISINGSGSYATLTFALKTKQIPVGTTIIVSDVVPSGYNGTYVVTSSTKTTTTMSVAYANTTKESATQNGNMRVKDFHREALDYAGSLGMKIVFSTAADDYGNYETVWETPALSTAYLNNYQRMLQRYKDHPAFMGIFLHEMYWHTFTSDEKEILRRQGMINALWVRARTIFDAENTSGRLELMANYGSNTRCNRYNTTTNTWSYSVDAQGFDGNYISNDFTQKTGQCRTETRTGPNALNKPLITLYLIAASDNYAADWLVRLPGLSQIRTANIALASTLQSTDCLKRILTACRLQNFFETLSNFKNTNTPFLIFSMYTARKGASPNTYWNYYNNSKYPGDGANEKIRSILASADTITSTPIISTATPVPTSTPITTPIPINNLTLTPGWNQVSSPIAEGIDISTIESSCTIVPLNNQKLWNWDAQTQSWTNPSRIEPFKGYWINVTNACTVTPSGTPAAFTSIPLYTGWNKISASGNLNDIKGTCSIIDNKTWNWDSVNKNWTYPSELRPDKGYWVKVTGNCTLD